MSKSSANRRPNYLKHDYPMPSRIVKKYSVVANQTKLRLEPVQNLVPDTKFILGVHSERTVVDVLQLSEGGNREVPTPAGYIDLLTKTEIIECKHVKDWKAAIGQVLVYSHYFPKEKKRIHLFGSCNIETLRVIEHHCKLLNIKLTLY